MGRGCWILGGDDLMGRELLILVEITASLSMVVASRRPRVSDEWTKANLELLLRVEMLARVLLLLPHFLLLTNEPDPTSSQHFQSSLLLSKTTLTLILIPMRQRSLAICSPVLDAPT